MKNLKLYLLLTLCGLSFKALKSVETITAPSATKFAIRSVEVYSDCAKRFNNLMEIRQMCKDNYIVDYNTGKKIRMGFFQKMNLSGADLSEKRLCAADMRKANLEGAILKNAELRATLLEHANLKNVNLSGAFLTGARLQHAKLNGAILIKADLVKANLEGADLRGADLTQAKLDYAKVKNAILDNNTKGIKKSWWRSQNAVFK